MTVLGVFIAGGIGALCRFACESLVKPVSSVQTQFPWSTFTVNLLGCMVAGFLFQQFVIKNPMAISKNTLTILFVGFLGGFTTFSGYALQVVRLWMEGLKPVVALSYLILSPVFGVAFVLVGVSLSKKLLN